MVVHSIFKFDVDHTKIVDFKVLTGNQMHTGQQPMWSAAGHLGPVLLKLECVRGLIVVNTISKFEVAYTKIVNCGIHKET